jgi:protein-tyrosine phosphatase
MAEAMFRDLVKREGLEHIITVDSAGTGDWHVGKPPHQGTQDILNQHQISFEGQVARQLVTTDLNDFDYIVAMDTQNEKNIHKLTSLHTSTKIVKLLDYVPEVDKLDVPDPYFTGNFQEVFDLLKVGCERLLKEIQTNENASREGK